MKITCLEPEMLESIKEEITEAGKAKKITSVQGDFKAEVVK